MSECYFERCSSTFTILLSLYHNSKKTRSSGSDPEKEGRLVEEQPSSTSLSEGTLLPCDPQLWSHVQYVKTEVKPITSGREQVEKIARSE